MTDNELHHMLNHIDAALSVFDRHEVKLTAFEISIKSMLVVVRSRVTEEIQFKQFSGVERTTLD
jgi:hypothetical protein